MRRLHGMASRFVREGNLAALLSDALDAAMTIVGADGGFIATLTGNPAALNVVAHRGCERSDASGSLPLASGPARGTSRARRTNRRQGRARRAGAGRGPGPVARQGDPRVSIDAAAIPVGRARRPPDDPPPTTMASRRGGASPPRSRRAPVRRRHRARRIDRGLQPPERARSGRQAAGDRRAVPDDRREHAGQSGSLQPRRPHRLHQPGAGADLPGDLRTNGARDPGPARRRGLAGDDLDPAARPQRTRRGDRGAPDLRPRRDAPGWATVRAPVDGRSAQGFGRRDSPDPGDEPRHHRPASPGRRAARGGRAQERVHRHALARAAQSAGRDPNQPLRARALHAGQRAGRPGDQGHRPADRTPGRDGRRSARRHAHHPEQDSTPPGAHRRQCARARDARRQPLSPRAGRCHVQRTAGARGRSTSTPTAPGSRRW